MTRSIRTPRLANQAAARARKPAQLAGRATECLPQQVHDDGSIGAICYIEEGPMLDPPVDSRTWLIEQSLVVAGPEAPLEYGAGEDRPDQWRRV